MSAVPVRIKANANTLKSEYYQHGLTIGVFLLAACAIGAILALNTLALAIESGDFLGSMHQNWGIMLAALTAAMLFPIDLAVREVHYHRRSSGATISAAKVQQAPAINLASLSEGQAQVVRRAREEMPAMNQVYYARTNRMLRSIAEAQSLAENAGDSAMIAGESPSAVSQRIISGSVC